MDTWLFWTDILQYLGEFDAAINTLLQASEYFPEEFEVEYRLAGLYLMLNETEKGIFHLSNGLRQSYKNKNIIEDFFPVVWESQIVQECVTKYKNN